MGLGWCVTSKKRTNWTCPSVSFKYSGKEAGFEVDQLSHTRWLESLGGNLYIPPLRQWATLGQKRGKANPAGPGGGAKSINGSWRSHPFVQGLILHRWRQRPPSRYRYHTPRPMFLIPVNRIHVPVAHVLVSVSFRISLVLVGASGLVGTLPRPPGHPRSFSHVDDSLFGCAKTPTTTPDWSTCSHHDGTDLVRGKDWDGYQS